MVSNRAKWICHLSSSGWTIGSRSEDNSSSLALLNCVHPHWSKVWLGRLGWASVIGLSEKSTECRPSLELIKMERWLIWTSAASRSEARLLINIPNTLVYAFSRRTFDSVSRRAATSSGIFVRPRPPPDESSRLRAVMWISGAPYSAKCLEAMTSLSSVSFGGRNHWHVSPYSTRRKRARSGGKISGTLGKCSWLISCALYSAHSLSTSVYITCHVIVSSDFMNTYWRFAYCISLNTHSSIAWSILHSPWI